ncbi:hypothetical protein LPTSP4_25250 [Leptospira ryugenii]|uniref:Uncharacterized protein n=1 Tax=Leptospira ryugenii TaxID=1917863 RepID=A0A2P2E2C3_9LEPT|nr:hypothetical protein [Leptospira ryugenii]GBF50994.1 hypothetical protein LPTSP4_25250 [Leptospira ryugenii]
MSRNYLQLTINRLFLFVLFVWFPFQTLSAQTKYDFPETKPGQYIYYLDKRGDQKRLTGILKFFDGTLICRTINLKDKSQTTITFQIEEKENNLELKPLKLISGNFEKDIQYVFVDLQNIATQEFKHKSSFTEGKDRFEDPWPEFGYTLEHTFWREIPFFHLYSTRKTDSETPNYEIAVMGRMVSGNDTSFFQFDFPLIVENQNAKFTVPSKTEQVFVSQGYSLILDENWKPHLADAKNKLYHDTFWLEVNSKRDAQIGIEIVENKKLPKEAKIKSSLDFAQKIANSTPMLLAISLYFNPINDKETTVSYIVFDLESKLPTIMIHRIKEIEPGKYHVINFSAFLETYSSNEDYFNQMLSKIK